MSDKKITYEGYGPGGAALLIEAVTSELNKTTANIRMILNQSGGSLGENGCVSWMFEKKGTENVTYTVSNKIDLDDATKKKLDSLIINLKENVDVQNIYTNVK